MKMKRLAAAALAGLTLLGAAPPASARHLAEEYMEAVQREKAERARMERERDARRQAWSRRRRVEDDPITERGGEIAEARKDETRDRQDAVSEAANAAEKPAADAAERSEREPERAAAVKNERRGAKTDAEAPPPDEMVEWKRRDGDEKRRGEKQHEEETRAVGGGGTESSPLIDFAENGTKDGREAVQPMPRGGGTQMTEEGPLAKYLRRARERAGGIVTDKPAAQAETGPKTLHVVRSEPMKELSVDKTDTGGTLLFSDSPEYVKEPGILYSDIVKGDARVFYYHLNDTKKNYKIAVVLENDSGQFAVLRVTRSAIAAPSGDYFEVGRGLQEIYFGERQRHEKLYIGSGEKRLLSETMDRTVLKPGELASGVFDFSVSAPVRVSVIFCPVREDPLAFVEEAKVLPNDEHRMRGTFIGMDRVIRVKRAYNPKRDGLRYLKIGDGEKDAFLKGVDATDGSLAENTGNYGVLYRLEIPVAGGKTIRAFMSPMGGSYGGVVRAEEKKEPEFRLLGVPEGANCFGERSLHPEAEKDGSMRLESSGDLAELGAYRGKTELFLEMSPPGASNLPVLLILAPDDIALQKDAPASKPQDAPKEPGAK